jgi:CBS domain-containing protein
MLEEAVFTAGDLMSRDVVVVSPDAPLLQAVTLMADHHLSGLPVVDSTGAMIGMISEGDLVRWHEGISEKQAHWLELLADGFELAPSFVESIRAQHNTVRSVMNTGVVVSVTEDRPAREVAHVMHQKGIKRVPVLRDGRLVGIVSRSDLIRALARKLAERSPEGPTHRSVDEALRRARQEPRG